MPSITKLAAAPAVLAAFSMLATPAFAAEVPAAPTAAAQPVLWSPEDDSAANHRYYRYRRGPDAGDIITGVLIIGGIAAIANAATKDRRERDARYPDARYPDARYPDARDRDDWRYRDSRRDPYDDSRGLDRAVQMCIDAVERDHRVDSVNSADRTASGWTVSGALANGKGWSCSIGNDGRIERIDTDGVAVPYRGADAAPDGPDYVPSGEDRQWDDDRYAAERARVDGPSDTQDEEAPADIAQGPAPAYPGGPLPGEDAQGDEPLSDSDTAI